MKHQKTIKKIIAVMLVSLFVIPGLMLCVSAEAEYDFDEIIANGSEAISGYQAEIDEVESRNLLADSKLLVFTADGTTDERQHAILAAVSRYLYPDEEIEDLDTCLQMYDPDAGCGRIGLKFSGMAIFVPEYEDMAVAMLLLNTYPEVEGVECNYIIYDEGPYKKGDVNADGEIDGTDYLMLKRYVLGTYVLGEVS